jgi:hypothetical protein
VVVAAQAVAKKEDVGTSMSQTNFFYTTAASPMLFDVDVDDTQARVSEEVPEIVDEVLGAVDSDFSSAASPSSVAASPPSVAASPSRVISPPRPPTNAPPGDELFSTMYAAFMSSRRNTATASSMTDKAAAATGGGSVGEL